MCARARVRACVRVHARANRRIIVCLRQSFERITCSLSSSPPAGTPASSNTWCALGTCTIEDTGRHPSSLSTGRRPAAARVPPLCAHARAHALKHFDTRACAHKHSTMQKLLSLFLSRARAFFLFFFRHMQSQEPAHVLKRPYSTYDIHCQIGAGSACAQLSLQYIRCLLPDRRLIMCSSIPIIHMISIAK